MASMVKGSAKTGVFHILNFYKKTSRKGIEPLVREAQSLCSSQYHGSLPPKGKAELLQVPDMSNS